MKIKWIKKSVDQYVSEDGRYVITKNGCDGCTQAKSKMCKKADKVHWNLIDTTVKRKDYSQVSCEDKLSLCKITAEYDAVGFN